MGPILFVIFINDLPDILPDETLAALYADDTKLYKSITSIGDCENLQQALTELDQWNRENNLDFNDSKCKVLTITRRKLTLTYAYHMNSKELSRVHKEKDLGFYINDNLSWHNHVDAITAKGNKMLGMLKRTCPLLTDTTVRRTLYLTLVKSQLSYAIVTEVWSPPTIKMRSKVESVQMRATSWIMQAKRGEVSYKQRLITLSLLPLCYNREIKDLVFFFKALYGRIDLDVHSFVSFNNNGRTRLCTNPSLTLKVPLCKTFQSSYFNRLVKLWNHVCKIAPSTTFASLSSFKRSLKAAYGNLVMTAFDVDLPCTWTLVRDCPCH